MDLSHYFGPNWHPHSQSEDPITLTLHAEATLRLMSSEVDNQKGCNNFWSRSSSMSTSWKNSSNKFKWKSRLAEGKWKDQVVKTNHSSPNDMSDFSAKLSKLMKLNLPLEPNENERDELMNVQGPEDQGPPRPPGPKKIKTDRDFQNVDDLDGVHCDRKPEKPPKFQFGLSKASNEGEKMNNIVQGPTFTSESITKSEPERKSVFQFGFSKAKVPDTGFNKLDELEANDLKPKYPSSYGFAQKDEGSKSRPGRLQEHDAPEIQGFIPASDFSDVFSSKKQGQVSSDAYGSSNKSLGMTKPLLKQPFKPPIPSSDDQEQSKPSHRPEPIKGEKKDGNLKNMDSELIERIKQEIMECSSTVDWDDIAGLEFVKDVIQEIIVLPMLRPDIFKGLKAPPKGILLFGPPGTGKTLIGKCIASQSKSTFFSISASSLTSKWVGEAEKMVRALFTLARSYQPSVVFIDEIDSLLSARSDSENECTRRIKTEFLVQLDGASTSGIERILVVGATNRPQDLDEAARRRLVKRLYVPLPDAKARKQIINKLMENEKHSLSEADREFIVANTEGYSGADMTSLCRDAAVGPIRSVDKAKIATMTEDDFRPVDVNDFRTALSRSKASVSDKHLAMFQEWNQTYGCTE